MQMETEVLVIGAGQAGLAAGFRLKRAGIAHVIVEALPRLGDVWRNRYASLTLFTPRRFSQLPGLDLAGDPDGYPSGTEFADYLGAYAAAHGLTVRTGVRVLRLGKSQRFRADLSDGTRIDADRVVIATGGFQRALRPALAAGFGEGVVQLTAEDYRRPDQLPGGPVLVVGDGASGRDIAAEMAGSRPVLLATGKPRKLVPERLFGRSIWWWLDKTGLLRAAPSSLPGRIMRARDPFPDRDRSIAALVSRGVTLRPRLTGASGRTARFADGSGAEVAAVVWATGYRDDTAWVGIPGAVARDGSFAHREGVSPVPGLFFVGRPWQRNRASALVMGAGDDAGRIVQAIAAASAPVASWAAA
jgi:putative flavoprotein involved in K+ transport